MFTFSEIHYNICWPCYLGLSLYIKVCFIVQICLTVHMYTKSNCIYYY